MARRIVADPGFATRLRELRSASGLSVRGLAALAYLAKSTISELENRSKVPTLGTARALDKALQTGGELAEMVAGAGRPAADEPWETADLLARLRASSVPPATVEALHQTVFALCCRYGRADAIALREEGHRWLGEVRRLLRRPVGLREHRELLTVAGWLALLVGCVEYDLGLAPAAEATRAAALELGRESGHPVIESWSWEMAAWFALTQGRYRDVLHAAEVGQAIAGGHPSVQLVAQEAKARARQGDLRGVRRALARGRRMLDRCPPPSHPEHHFIVDPGKWDFYAMDAYRRVGDDTRARHHAEQVLRHGIAPDGSERAPMRLAEARLTLGVVAAREGEVERAVATGVAAFRASRRCLPQLRMVASELDAELRRRDPQGRVAGDFHSALSELRPPRADG